MNLRHCRAAVYTRIPTIIYDSKFEIIEMDCYVLKYYETIIEVLSSRFKFNRYVEYDS